MQWSHLLPFVLLPAWVFAAANIFMSPKAAFVHIRCSKENIVLSRHYIRSGVDLLVPHPVSIGPQVLGRGEGDPPITISYSDIESLDWNGFAFELRLQHGENIIVQVKMPFLLKWTSYSKKLVPIFNKERRWNRTLCLLKRMRVWM